MKPFYATLVSTLSFLAAPPAHAGVIDVDILPRVENSQIVTNGYDDATGTEIPNIRVYAWEFDDPADPFFLSDPGLNAPAGSGLPAGKKIGVRALSDLLYWNGTGPVSFGPTPNQETLTLAFGAGGLTLGTATGQLPDFFFGPLIQNSGAVHVHLSSLLNGADDNNVPASIDGVEPTPGLYAYSLSMIASDHAILPSQPIVILHNVGQDPVALQAAIDHFDAPFVPEPASLSVFGAGALLTRRRRCASGISRTARP